MSLREVFPNLLVGDIAPPIGSIRKLWQTRGVRVLIGHPTFKNESTIGRLLSEGISACVHNFPEVSISFIVSDGTFNSAAQNRSTMEAAITGAKEGLASLTPEELARVTVIITPYEGYDNNTTPGKGSALRLIFSESLATEIEFLILLDGDLRNDMNKWQNVFAQVVKSHRRSFSNRPYFITARYARHFVDASLTRFIVGPLTTLTGRYVPGGISGDICLSSEAASKELACEWTESRCKYGTDISTTFDQAAHEDTVIYEVYLGAKLHDITDEAKLAVMPMEVIKAAFERLLYWEDHSAMVSRTLSPSAILSPLEIWGPDKTGITFVDPGYTDVFDIDRKITSLIQGFSNYRPAIDTVHGTTFSEALALKLCRLQECNADMPLSLNIIDLDCWVDVLLRTVAYCLMKRDLETTARSLTFLYSAAFLTFVGQQLTYLGLTTLSQIRKAQHHLGVAPEQAEEFYTQRIDKAIDNMAHTFFRKRTQITELINSSNPSKSEFSVS